MPKPVTPIESKVEPNPSLEKRTLNRPGIVGDSFF